MESTALRDILIIFILIFINGFFSLSEMSLVSSQKARLLAKAKNGKKAYKRALAAKEQPGRFLSTIQIGITLIGILAGAFGGSTLTEPLRQILVKIPFIGPYAEGLAVAFVVIGITYFSIILGELVPKQVALSKPESIASLVVPILDTIAIIFKPLVSFLSLSTSILLKILHIREAPAHTMTEEELQIALQEGQQSGIVMENERSMVEGIFYLGDRPVETFMTYRSEVEWLDSNKDLIDLKPRLLEPDSPKYYPICNETPDEVIGIVSKEDLLAQILQDSKKSLKSIMKKPIFVPETMSALKAFDVFKREQVEYILVMDEYGGFSGTLSLQDLIEEIVGELSRPDNDTEDIILREDGSYLLGGAVNIDEAAELLGFGHLIKEHHEFHTLAGFILEIAGEIPRTGATYPWNGYVFEVVDMDGNRIDKVIVKKPAKITEESEPLA
ncbi:MAG TPA: hemolysin family protein [Treponema sp.]|nr:HlyC/CorC family transporter [Treponema sp.]HPC70201.1 hemolysin family protein [Treponema sp.]HRS02743.1 hemolysin family protein [Treponema sp.]HRU27339.1 hemolysin family protein [Treponema sp.]